MTNPSSKKIMQDAPVFSDQLKFFHMEHCPCKASDEGVSEKNPNLLLQHTCMWNFGSAYVTQTSATSCGPGANLKMILAHGIITVKSVFLGYNSEHKQYSLFWGVSLNWVNNAKRTTGWGRKVLSEKAHLICWLNCFASNQKGNKSLSQTVPLLGWGPAIN